MKPLGLRTMRFPGKTDHHIKGKLKKQGYVNWWEVIATPNKTREKRAWMKEAWDAYSREEL